MELSILEKKLLYEFKDKSLLGEACRHSSYVNEQPFENVRDNERLEFLGDAVLNLAVGHILMVRYPELSEGDLSRMRAGLVNEFQLAKIAKSIDLGAYLQLGKGEIQTEGRKKKSILADTFEAVIAAIYLDGGFEAAFRFVADHFSKAILSIAKPADYKSLLQEEVQVTLGAPAYTLIQENGPDHDKTFIIQISVGDISAEGSGKSKKTAEQDAAKKALELLGYAF